jgi:hypothetical protein
LETSDTFKACALRHWQDGSLLEKHSRFSNANQLFGFATECAIKSAMCELAEFLSSGKLVREQRKHINELWEGIRLSSLQKRFPRLVATLKQSNPFHDWSIDHRYSPENEMRKDIFQRHQRAMQQVLTAAGISGARKS